MNDAIKETEKIFSNNGWTVWLDGEWYGRITKQPLPYHDPTPPVLWRKPEPTCDDPTCGVFKVEFEPDEGFPKYIRKAVQGWVRDNTGRLRVGQVVRSLDSLRFGTLVNAYMYVPVSIGNEHVLHGVDFGDGEIVFVKDSTLVGEWNGQADPR